MSATKNHYDHIVSASYSEEEVAQAKLRVISFEPSAIRSAVDPDTYDRIALMQAVMNLQKANQQRNDSSIRL